MIMESFQQRQQEIETLRTQLQEVTSMPIVSLSGTMTVLMDVN
jgi:hypothetical protein